MYAIIIPLAVCGVVLIGRLLFWVVEKREEKRVSEVYDD
jgi:hypothetical protein